MCGSSNAARRRLRFVDGKPFVTQHGVRGARPDHGPARRRSRPQAGHGPGNSVLPWLARRQELAARRLQPADADDLHPGQQQRLRPADGHAHHLRARQGASRARRPACRSWRRARRTSAPCRPGTWTRAGACGRTVRHHAELGVDALDGGWTRVQRRHERPPVPRVRRRDRQAAVAVPGHVGHRRAADVVCHRRQAVHRGGVGMGRGSGRHAAGAEPHLSDQHPPVPEGGAVWVFALP